MSVLDFLPLFRTIKKARKHSFRARFGKSMSSVSQPSDTEAQHQEERGGIAGAKRRAFGKLGGEAKRESGKTDNGGKHQKCTDQPDGNMEHQNGLKNFFHTRLGCFVSPTFVFNFYGLSSQYEKVRLVFKGLDPRAKKERSRSRSAKSNHRTLCQG